MPEQTISCIVAMTELRDIQSLRQFFAQQLKLRLFALKHIQQSTSRKSHKPLDTEKYEQHFRYINDLGNLDEKLIQQFLDHYSFDDSNIGFNHEQSQVIFIIPINKTINEYIVFNQQQHNQSNLSYLSNLSKVYKNQTQLLLATELDPLTNLNNRRSFELITNKVFSQNDRGNICLAMLDIDFFKKVNDDFGHLYGDEVLLLFAQLLIKEFRTSDYIFRYGGEEFAVILMNTTPLQARKTLERFRRTAEEYSYPQVGHKTVSIGYSFVAGNDIPSVIDNADKALYYSKENGRNRIAYYSDINTSEKSESDSGTHFF